MVDNTIPTISRYVSFAQTHPGKVRPYNQDAILDMSAQGVWVVADGMGGHAAGGIASQMVVDAIEKHVTDSHSSQLCVDGIRAVLTEVNNQVFTYAHRHCEGEVMGSTVVVLHIQDGFFHCLWAGDSRIYLYRNSRLQRKTRDHSQVMEMVEQGLIQESDAEQHPLSNVITRAIGVSDEITIDQVSGQLLAGDQFLLCSDGLSKEVDDRHIAKCMQANNVSDIGLALMHSSLVKGASDNVSCAVIKVCGNDQYTDTKINNDDTVPVIFSRRA